MPDQNDATSRDAARQPPICTNCGLPTIDLRASFLNPSTGKTVRIYKCECGKLVWDPTDKIG
jgi:hypothetical protein